MNQLTLLSFKSLKCITGGFYVRNYVSFSFSGMRWQINLSEQSASEFVLQYAALLDPGTLCWSFRLDKPIYCSLSILKILFWNYFSPLFYSIESDRRRAGDQTMCINIIVTFSIWVETTVVDLSVYLVSNWWESYQEVQKYFICMTGTGTKWPPVYNCVVVEYLVPKIWLKYFACTIFSFSIFFILVLSCHQFFSFI